MPARCRRARRGEGGALNRWTLSILLLASAAAPAAAQSETGAFTGTGGGPLSTRTAPYTTAAGRTMPPDGAASRAPRDDADRPSPGRREQDVIAKSIRRQEHLHRLRTAMRADPMPLPEGR